MLILLTLFACIKAPTAEEAEERKQRYVDALVEDVSVYKPNANTVCYVVRGISQYNPRTMSCVSTCPAPVKP